MKRLCVLLLVAGCATPPDPPVPRPTEAFFARLQALCGKAFAGRVVSTEAADADMRGTPLIMHVRECSADTIRVPFHVGADRSRTWVISRTEGGLRLKHDHRHEDGGEDVLTQYGGDAAGGTAERQEFPADIFSKALFLSKGNPASVTNVWAMQVRPGRLFAYELRRPSRYLRAEFNLSQPIAAPSLPWGAE